MLLKFNFCLNLFLSGLFLAISSLTSARVFVFIEQRTVIPFKFEYVYSNIFNFWSSNRHPRRITPFVDLTFAIGHTFWATLKCLQPIDIDLLI